MSTLRVGIFSFSRYLTNSQIFGRRRTETGDGVVVGVTEFSRSPLLRREVMQDVAVIEGLAFGALLFYLSNKHSTKEERMLDKSDKNVPATAVGVALAKASAEKESVDTKEVVEDVIMTLDIPDTPAPLIFQGIEIYGAHLISKRLLELALHVIGEDDFIKEDVVHRVVFSENYPIDVNGESLFAGYLLDSRTVGINLQRHFDACVTIAKKDNAYLSIRGYILYNLLLSLYHELYHGLFIVTETEDEIDLDQLEETCSEMADEAITALVREYDISPAPMADEPFFGPRYMEMWIREINEGTAPWQEIQQALHDEKHIYYDADRKEFIANFRTWIRFTYGGDPDLKDAAWDNEGKSIRTQAPEPEPASDAEVAIQAGTVASGPTGVTGEGMDEETAAMVDMEAEMGGDQNAYAMEDHDMLPAEAAGLNAAQAGAVNSTEVLETKLSVEHTMKGHVVPPGGYGAAKAEATLMAFCTGCGTQLAAGMKFCGGCGTAVASIATEAVVAQALPVQTGPLVSEAGPVQATPEVQPGGAGTYRQVLRTDLPNHNFTPDQIRSMTEQLLHTLYAHIFNKCGYGVMANPAFDEMQKWAILEHINVSDIEGIDKFLIAADVHDRNTNDTKVRVPVENGMISGKCTKKSGLPSYTVYLNCNGIELKRVLMPQNPWKDKGGFYSKPAIRAQGGSIIAWIMDGDDNSTKKWRGWIENSVFHWKV